MADSRSSLANAAGDSFRLGLREIARDYSRIADRRSDNGRRDDGAIDQNRHRPTDMGRSCVPYALRACRQELHAEFEPVWAVLQHRTLKGTGIVGGPIR